MDEDIYELGYAVTWVLTFLGCWIYCIAAYGFLLGVGLGWLPAAITATIVAFAWPLIAALVVLGIVLVLWILS